MTEFTKEKLAELRVVAEAAFPVEDWAIWEDLTEGGFVHVGNARGVIPEGEIATPEDAEPNPVAKAYTPELGRHIATFDPPTALALIDALEAKTAEVDAKADYVSDLEERVRQRDNHVIPVLHARIKEAERERDEARAEVERLKDARAIFKSSLLATEAMGGRSIESLAEALMKMSAEGLRERADRAEAALERVTRDEFADKIARRVHATNHGDDDEPDEHDLDPNYAAGKHGQDILALIRAETGAEQ